jgi:uncharacterized membrane protein
LTVENNKVCSGRLSRETLAILALILSVSIAGAIITIVHPTFIFTLLPGGTTYVIGGTVYEVIYAVLTLATDGLYIFGGVVIAYGAILVIVRFLQCKLRDPYKPSLSTRYLSGYLTLGLEIFIGAEIIRTVIVRTPDEFALLILVIVSRGLFSLILYLERRWYGTAETE